MSMLFKSGGFVLLALLAVAASLAGCLPPQLHNALLREGGPVETVSALSYLLGAGYLLWQGRSCFARLWPAALLLLHLAVREAGMRTALLGGSGLSLVYYLDAALPLWRRSVTAILLLATLFALGWLLRQVPAGWRALQRGDASAIWLAGALALGVFAQLFDNWSKLFGAAPPALMPFLLAWEEVFELGMGLGMLLAVYRWQPRMP